MVVTVYNRTTFGPYLEGSVFVTSAAHTQRLFDTYGQGRQVVNSFGQPVSIREGGTYYIVSYSPGPGPGPYPGRNNINVYFYVDVDSYYRSYSAGQTYRLSPRELQEIIRQNPQLFVSDQRGNKINPRDYDNFIGRTLYVNQSAILYSMPQIEEESPTFIAGTRRGK